MAEFEIVDLTVRQEGPERILKDLEAEVADLRSEVSRHHRDFAQWEDMASRGAAQIARVQVIEQALDILWAGADIDPVARTIEIPWETWGRMSELLGTVSMLPSQRF